MTATGPRPCSAVRRVARPAGGRRTSLRRGLRGGGMERVERLLLELAHAFGTDAQVGSELAQRLHRPVEPVAAAQDPLLAAPQARDPGEKARERKPTAARS